MLLAGVARLYDKPIEKCMEPDKLSANEEVTATSLTTAPKNDTKDLLNHLESLLNGNKVIDEHRAKSLRKSWDSLKQDNKVDDSALAKLEKGFEVLRERIHQQVDERNGRYAEIEQDLVKLKAALAADDLKSSQDLEQLIISKLNHIQGLSSQRRQKIIGELEAFQPKIKKLSSWRHWGTVQAREKIIKEIQNIHNAETDLEKVATRIKQAREQWKQWDNTGEGGNKKLYLTFDRACTAAYEPCKALFETQRKQREESSCSRINVCEFLENEYEKTDWRDPNWKNIQKNVRDQVSRWRKLGPAEYKDRKPLHRRFERIIEKFEGPLDRERKRNLYQRQELIAEINKLVELEDTRKAMAELQPLKKKWLVTVSGRRKQEQTVWKQFTSACDAVYEKSRQSKKEFDQQLNLQLEIKQKICSEIEAKVQEKYPEAAVLTAQINQWNNRWSQSGRAPKANAKKIEKRFRDAIGKAHKLRGQLEQADQSKNDQLLFDCAALCSDTERQVFEQCALDLDAINESWQQLGPIDQSLQSVLQARMDQAVTAATDSSQRRKLEDILTHNFELVNGYLLQLEINAGVDSPATYSKQRMALQIGRLSNAMGKASEQELLNNRELINRIHTTGALPPDSQLEVDKRFKQCYTALYNDNH